MWLEFTALPVLESSLCIMLAKAAAELISGDKTNLKLLHVQIKWEKRKALSDVLSSLVSIGESRLKFMLQLMNLMLSRFPARQNFSELTELFKAFGFNFQNRSVWFGSEIFGVFRKINLRLKIKRKRKRNARKAEKKLIKLNVILILKSLG